MEMKMKKKLCEILIEFTNNIGKSYSVKKYPIILIEIFDEAIEKIEELYKGEEMKFDFNMRNALAKNLHTQGSLMGCGIVDPQRDEQLRFLEKVIREVKPLHIAETGTHYAGFDYFVMLIDKSIGIDTFGINEGSQKAVDILNKHFKTNIQFHLGDSADTFTEFAPEYKIDFAWIDGGRTEKACFTDLYNCSVLKIDHICCDDYSMLMDVRMAVAHFLHCSPEYKVQGIDREIDKRRIIYLKRG